MSDIWLSDRVQVHDGDTPIVDGERLRLRIGDAPEVANEYKQTPAAAGSREATEATARALSDGYAIQTAGEDRYGRPLFDAHKEGSPTLSNELLANGLTFPPHWKTIEGDDGGSAMARDGADIALGIERDPNYFKVLGDRAREQRINDLMGKIKSGALAPQMFAIGDNRDPAEDPERSLMGSSFARGVDTMQGTFYGFADALGSVSGIDVLAEWGQEGVAKNVVEAMRNPAQVESWEDIDGLADAMIYGLEAVGEFAPQLLTDVSAGLATGGAAVVTKQLLAGAAKSMLRKTGGPMAVSSTRQLGIGGVERSLFGSSAKAGAFTSAYLQNTGETQNQFRLEGIDNPEGALALGVGKAALDYMGLDATLRQAFKGLRRDAITPESFAQVLRRSAGATGIAFSAESVTEATQTLMDELAIGAQKDGYEINWSGVLDAALKGGIGGGTAGGGTNLALGTLDMLASPPSGDTPVLPGADSLAQDTAPEPFRDIAAQIRNTPPGEGNWYTRENAEQARQVAAEAGKQVLEQPDGSVVVADADVLASLPPEVTQADLARLNGYAQTKDQAAADETGTVVVETRDADGAVLRSQLVGATIADAVREQQATKFPQATTTITTPEATVKERAKAVDAEAVAAALKEADGLGINLGNFAKKGMGAELVEQLTERLTLEALPGKKRLRMLNGLEPLAELLGMDAAQLTLEAHNTPDGHGRKNIFRARQALLDTFTRTAQEKYGSVQAFSEAVDMLPKGEAAAIRQAFGLKTEGGFDLAGLKGAIAARKPAQPPVPVDPLAGEEATATPAPKPGADRLREAVFAHPALRTMLSDDAGRALDDDAVQERFEKLPAGKRMRLESWLKDMDIDVGGANRAAFLELLHDAVAERAAYGIGKARVDDADTESTDATVQTVEFDPSALDSEDARLFQLVSATSLTEKAGDWPIGAERYLKAISKIMRAGEEAETSALDAREAEQLAAATLVARVFTQLGLPPRLLAKVAQHFKITDAMASRAAGAEVTAEQALAGLADGNDRAAKGLTRWVAVRLVPDLMFDSARVNALVELGNEDPGALADSVMGAIRDTGDISLLDAPEWVAFYEESSRAERMAAMDRPGERLETASTRGADQAAGDEVAIDANQPNENEQHASDRAFFGYVNGASIRNWDFSHLPTEAELQGATFTSGASEIVTKHVKGKNLLSLPAVEGSVFGRVVDAVALGRYAQSGDHAPQSLTDAASNFITNVGRYITGGQSNHDPRGESARGFLRTIPDDVVIYVEPGTGVARTYGEALAQGREDASAREAYVIAQRELDTANDAIEVAAAELATASERLAGMEVDPGATQQLKDAAKHWQLMLAGEKVEAPNGAVLVRPRAPNRAIGAESRFHKAFKALGRQVRVGNSSLEEAFSAYLGQLSARKKLSATLRAAADRWSTKGDFDPAAQAEADVRSELDETGTELSVAAQRAIDADLRSSEALGEPDDVPAGARYDREFDPAIDVHDPLESIAGWGEKVAALSTLAREGRMRVMREAPQGESTRAKKHAPALPISTRGSHNIADSRFRELVERIEAQGVPLPDMNLVVADGKADLAKLMAAAGITGANAQLMAEKALDRDSFYFLDDRGVANIYIAPRAHRDHQMADLAHELGHAVKDQVWGGLLGGHRDAMERGFKDDMGFAAKNDDQMHEWFADQFAKAVLAHREQVTQREEGIIDGALRALLNRLTKLWAEITGTSAEMNPAFREFARSLFAGEYANSAARHFTARAGVVRNASGLEREQRRLRSIGKRGNPVLISGDGAVTIRARRRLDAGSQELENTEDALKWGHAAWLAEGNSFWRVDLFVRGPHGVGQVAGVGILQMRDSDGSVQAIHDITMYTKRQGHGEKVVASILASGEPVHIIEAIPEAQPFWNKMGAFDGYDPYKNVWLTWAEYARAKQHFGGSERLADGQGGLGETLREADPTSGGGQGGVVGDPGIDEGNAELDAESLAFLEDFLTEKPKVRNASGIADLHALRSREQALKTQAKAFWARGVGATKHLAPVFSMVYSRIARIDSGLARALFQPANERQSALGQSWEQRSRALKGRMMAQVDKLLTDLQAEAKGGRAARDAAVQRAFEDAYTGSPKTAAGKRVRALTAGLSTEAARAGLRSVDLTPPISAEGIGHTGPVVFNRQAVANRPADFQKLVAEALKVDAREAQEIVERIVDGPGTLDGAIAPGSPVGMHRTNRDLVSALGYEALRDGGWLLDKHAEALFHWVDGVSKRAAWEAIFGGNENAEFNPNLKFVRSLEAIRNESGEQAAAEVMALVNGALGRHPAGQRMPGWWRSTQEFITGWVGMSVLAFSGIASIPELALPLVRSAGRVGIREAFQNFGEAKRFARDMGIVLSDASEQVVWQATGDQYRSPLISKAQGLFFRINGNAFIVRTARTLATGIGIRYLLAATADGDNGALARLNIDAATVAAWDAAGRPTWSPEQSPDIQLLAAKVTDAVNQFVNEATLNPSRFQATHWGNNPYMKMIWHLKHFLFTYGDTVLLGMYREMRRRWQHLDPRELQNAMAIAAPALIFGLAVMPLAAFSLEARDWMRRLNGRPAKEYESAFEYVGAAFERAGGLGPLSFLANMRQQQEWGMSVWGSISPTAGKVDMLFSDQPVDEKLRQLTPIWSQNKTLLGLLE